MPQASESTGKKNITCRGRYCCIDCVPDQLLVLTAATTVGVTAVAAITTVAAASVHVKVVAVAVVVT